MKRSKAREEEAERYRVAKDESERERRWRNDDDECQACLSLRGARKAPAKMNCNVMLIRTENKTGYSTLLLLYFYPSILYVYGKSKNRMREVK